MENNIKSTSVPMTPPSQVTPESIKASNVKGVLIILAVLEVVTILIAGYYAYQFTQLKRQVSNNQPAPTPISNSALATTTPTPISQVTPTPDVTANWKTFIEAQYGFSFKYQPTQVVDRNEYNSIYGGREIVLTTKYNGNSFDWFVEENTKGVSFETYTKDFTSQGGEVVYTGKIITIGKISGALAEISGYMGQLDADYAHLEFYVVGKNNSLYRLRLYTNEMVITDSDRQLFNTILESIEIK